ncbi:hypothetical protein [Bradyrhizobium icense]|uniref:Uncharacterized protein n=1 Tax=Bradyrhizobium icense TaxID=1274631 RepID=A0A1B1U9A4_9BRAD|nr:hypothetical protein [Bradyrhizobium icense]ANV99353.1 hypothetical protein LMTR13_03330 [Bradyrhizobium icense]
MIEFITSALMLLGAIGVIVQHYPRWKKYHDPEDRYWIYAGVLTILTVIYFFVTKHVITITPENVTFLIWSRRVLITVAFLAWLVLGYRRYILRNWLRVMTPDQLAELKDNATLRKRNGVTIYKANKLVGLPALLIPALLVIPVLNAEVPLENRLIGLGIFLVITVAIVVVPFGARLEVGDNHVATYLFGFSTMPKIYRSDIQVIVYRNLFHGGLGAGKGISFRALIRGRSKAYSIGEAMYGKEAITHARRVLS